MPEPTLLVILDGWGHNPEPENNAIAAADTPTWDALWSARPRALIGGSGADVGLPDGQMGNSEVGHMNLGAGRVVYQDLTRINRAIEQDEFARNHSLNRLMDKVTAADANGAGQPPAVHVFGLLSPGGVHSHEDQIHALIRILAERSMPRVFLHAFLDGRDTPPKSAAASIDSADALLRDLGVGRIVSVTGRYFAMDRDNRWDRVERAYNLMVRGEAPFHAATATEGLTAAYDRDETDEFVQPTAIHDAGELPTRIEDGDAVVFMNFRADRARQLTRAFVMPDFDAFNRRSVPTLSDFVTLTRYAEDIDTPCAFDTPVLTNTFGEYLAELGRTQLRIAETEKYAHVTFFFSGGREAPFEHEHRLLVPSPKVATYDLQPEMSARKVTDELVDAIREQKFDAIVCNYANGDMVGHTGDFAAAIEAVETLDACLARLVEAIEAAGGQMLITADHGNVERMVDPDTHAPHTAHTCEPVPLVYVGSKGVRLADGVLSDIAPTLLRLMDLPAPKEMTGRSLATIDAPESRRA